MYQYMLMSPTYNSAIILTHFPLPMHHNQCSACVVLPQWTPEVQLSVVYCIRILCILPPEMSGLCFITTSHFYQQERHSLSYWFVNVRTHDTEQCKFEKDSSWGRQQIRAHIYCTRTILFWIHTRKLHLSEHLGQISWEGVCTDNQFI